MLWTFLQSFSFIPHTASEEIEYFFANLSFRLPWQPIKFSSLDKIHMLHRRLLKENFCKTFVQISTSEIAIHANFNFSHYKSVGTISCHSNQSSCPIGTKTQLFVPPAYRCCMWNMKRIGFTAQRRCRLKKLTDNGRQTTTDGQRMSTYTISSPMSLRLRLGLRLRLAKNLFSEGYVQ